VDNQKNEHKNEINSATLAVIAGLITTLGDALSTIAAIMALEESQQEKTQIVPPIRSTFTNWNGK